MQNLHKLLITEKLYQSDLDKLISDAGFDPEKVEGETGIADR